MPLRLPLFLPCVPMLTAAAFAQATAVTVSVADKDGRPAADAVVMLEQASARAPVRPMPQTDISQARRQFSPRVTAVTTGTPVNFPNFDTVRHHVYSFSDAKKFELKLYSGVPNKPIVFDKPGVVILGCNIHDQMVAWIVVSDTPWFGVTGEDGKLQLADVPAGSYRMRIWHPAMPVNTEAPVSNLTVGNADLSLTSRLAVSAAP